MNKKTPKIPYLVLKDGRVWNLEFSKDFNLWIYSARKYTYGLFVNNVYEYRSDMEPFVWIGAYDKEARTWYTVEDYLGVKEVHLGRGVFCFKN